MCLFGLAVAVQPMQSQITLEQTYPSAGYYNTLSVSPQIKVTGAKLFYMVKLEISGEKYVAVDMLNQSINFYNLNHTLFANVSYSNVTLLGNPTAGVEKVNASLLYISENLFDTDNQIELMYMGTYYDYTTDTQYAVTQIVNQDGSIMFTATNEAPLVKPNYHSQYYPIYNTAAGTKLILSKTNGDAKVYSLGGTWSGMLANNSINLSENALTLSPNPSGRGSAVRMEYDLPQGVNTAELKVFDGTGKELKSYKIGSDMHEVMVEPGDLPAGDYYYYLSAEGKVIGTKKSVVME